MTVYEKQYAYYFSKLGYKTEFYPEKSLFFLPELNLYAKCCGLPALPEIVEKANSLIGKHNVILLEGNLTFKPYTLFRTKDEIYPVVMPIKGTKYAPYFFEQWFDLDVWPDEAAIIALAINNGVDFTCHRCGSVNDFTVSKPSLHHKITCNCGAYITNVSENKPSALYFGKYKGRTVDSMTTPDEVQYLQWGLAQNMF